MDCTLDVSCRSSDVELSGRSFDVEQLSGHGSDAELSGRGFDGSFT